eukprot:5944433-Pleurochrysis_carterae.AAC.1
MRLQHASSWWSAPHKRLMRAGCGCGPSAKASQRHALTGCHSRRAGTCCAWRRWRTSCQTI